MAVFTFSLTALTPATKTISAGDVTKMKTAITFRLAQEGNPAPTDQQIFDHMASLLWARLVDYVKNTDRERVASLVQDIILT